MAMGIRRWHLDRKSVGRESIANTAIQSGRTSVDFAFAATGLENKEASITFPTPFAAAPAVVVAIEGISVGIARVAVTATGFSVVVRDDKGLDYTSTQTATVNWIAVAV